MNRCTGQPAPALAVLSREELARIGHPSIINTFNYRIFMNSVVV